MKIEKKIWPVYFQRILDGNKNYELRLADFKCKPGDIFFLREWDPKSKKYTRRILEKKITNVVKTKDVTFYTKKEIDKYGFQIISF